MRTTNLSTHLAYVPNVIPLTQDELPRFLKDELDSISRSIGLLASGHFDTTNVAPTRPREGDIRLADGTNWNPGNGAGLYLYTSSAWTVLQAGTALTVSTLVGTDTTDSTSSTTGAFKTAGGMGIAKKLYVGTSLSAGTTITAGTSVTATAGRSTFAAASEPYAINVKYVNTGGSIFFGAASGDASPDGVISNASGTELVRFASGGNVGIGTTTFGTSAAKVLGVKTGTAPTTGPADTVQFYSSDDAAGHTIPSFFCEGTNVIATGQADSVSSVRVKMRINGTVVTLLAI